MAYAFNSTNPNLNRAVNALNKKFLNLGGIVNGLFNGGGTVAENANVETAVQWAIAIANDNTHGYDQAYRDGPNYDCSSLVSHAFQNAGFNIINGYTPSTREMRSVFTSAGFTWYPGTPSETWLRRGDILLKEDAHTEIYIGDGQNVGAHGNEFGGITGGRTGDQTGHEIDVGSYYVYRGGWDGVLRYTPSGSGIGGGGGGAR